MVIYCGRISIHDRATYCQQCFLVFGGVPKETALREGRLRCQGAFAHPIVAGCFWASNFPIVVSLFTRKMHVLAAVSCLACTLIVASTSSSTPVFGFLTGLLGFAFWYFRILVIPTLITVTVALPILHLVMKAPVWHLVSRVSAVGGSTSWHRFNLIDQTIARFPEWAFFGTKTTAHWGHHLFDVANFYVHQAVFGGVLTFSLFIGLMASVFVACNTIISRVPAKETFAAWCLGVTMMIHAANFIGLSYFGQITLLLFLHLACVSGLLNQYKKQRV